jgi:hypothetical protein
MKRFYMQDALSQMERGFGYHDNLPDTHKEYRYEERDDEYRLRCWRNGHETSETGLLDNRAEWLVRIVDMAKIGGHMANVKFPPPMRIVWFQTDANNNLESFKEMPKHDL